jgi:cell division protein FtsW
MKTWLEKNVKGDPVIWCIVLALSIMSVLVVYSATGTIAYKKMQGNTEHYLLKHSGLVILGLAAMWIAHKIDYRYYSGISRLALWFSVPLLIFSFFFGSKLNDASRWITIPFINSSFQPSDLAKLALISNVASMLAKRQQNIADIKVSLIPILIWCGIICGLIALTNFSTSLLLFSTCMLLMFIGRVPVKYLFTLVVVGLLAGSMALFFGQRMGTVISRLDQYKNSLVYSEEAPFQAQQSYVAIATGGIVGKGPGQSDQRNFLPHPYSDFIFAIIVEEYGLLGGLFTIFLYLALLYRGMLAVSRSDRAFGGLLSAGLCFSLVIQAMINMGVSVGLIPITGLPLPLLSMGGTSLLFTGLSIGIIISVSRGEIKEGISRM